MPAGQRTVAWMCFLLATDRAIAVWITIASSSRVDDGETPANVTLPRSLVSVTANGVLRASTSATHTNCRCATSGTPTGT